MPDAVCMKSMRAGPINGLSGSQEGAPSPRPAPAASTSNQAGRHALLAAAAARAAGAPCRTEPMHAESGNSAALHPYEGPSACVEVCVVFDDSAEKPRSAFEGDGVPSAIAADFAACIVDQHGSSGPEEDVAEEYQGFADVGEGSGGEV